MVNSLSLISLIDMEDFVSEIIRSTFPVHRFVQLESALGIVIETKKIKEAINFFYEFVYKKIQKIMG